MVRINKKENRSIKKEAQTNKKQNGDMNVVLVVVKSNQACKEWWYCK